ncbi:NACHT domain-containing protein [Pseudarthrobacter sp. S9]|uniref:NACHT domain-containing protein n=1 Tax=Pseudarthrobacter sp. S9 TaxID=3418421 RepID=UPI003D00DFE4
MTLLTPLISAALGTIAKRTADALLDPQHRLEDRLVLEEFIQIGDLDADENAIIITGEQERLVLNALRSPECGRLIQTFILSKMTLDPHDLAEVRIEFTDAFQRLLEIEFKEQEFIARELAQSLWPLLENFVAHVGSDALSSNVKGLLTARRSTDAASEILQDSAPLPLYVRQLLESISGLERIKAARNAAFDIRREIKSSFGVMNMDHLLEGDFRVDKKDVFIHRTLTERGQSAKNIETSELPIGPNGIGRVVVLGDPGVGKTTLLGHMVAEIASDEDGAMVPILVTCRNFSPDSAFEMDKWVTRDFRVVRSLNIGGGVIKDILATGQAVVLFDGIDEVIDPGRRSQLVSEIEAFVRRYPLCPVLATARRVGYERIALKENFRVFGLREFTDDQVSEYASLWFLKRNAPEVTRRFLMNSESIKDIRSNPLMLSLLCDVYRARGYLPRNRFEVYGNCAELLFTRWDSMRDIETPPDHMRYGARLFEELAWLFHSSQNARSGVEERQLVRLLAEFFRRNAGVDVSESSSRARRFLEFCADRAWLLSAQYRNDRGERIFSFTHRTFLEYYAAQAIVKRSEHLGVIVSAIRSAFVHDPSSVLCDLILQYYDSTKYDGGADILLVLLKAPEHEVDQAAEARLSLCLRLADAIALPSHVMDVLVDSIRSAWSVLPATMTRDSSFALFALNRDARARVILRAKESYASRPQVGRRSLLNLSFLEGLVARWTWFDALGMTSLADEGWRESIDDLVLLGHQHEPWKSGEVLTYILRHSVDCDVTLAGIPSQDLFAVQAFNTGAPGLITDSLFGPSMHPGSAIAWDDLSVRFKSSTNRTRKVDYGLARLICAALEAGNYNNLQRPSREMLYWYAFVSYEYSGEASVCEEVEDVTFDHSLLPQIFDQRSAAEGGSKYESEDDPATNSLLSSVNEVIVDTRDRRWIRQWIRGNSSLLER